MRRIVPLVPGIALFMEQMDSTIISTALPSIAADLQTEPLTLKLALTSYLIALASLIPISGWAADRFGARNVFRVAILVFVAGSIACAVSSSLGFFVGARFVQGMGASMMTPVARLILLRSTARTDLVRSMALLSIPAMIGPMVGPPVGGFLTVYAGWPAIFWVNVPLGLVGVYVAGRILPPIQQRSTIPLDAIGLVLSTITLCGLIVGLSTAAQGQIPWHVSAAALAIGLAAGGLYFLHARRAPHPVLRFSLLRRPLFRATIVSGSLLRFGIAPIPFLLPLMLQLTFGLDPLQSGLVTFVAAFGGLMSRPILQPALAAFGFRTVIVVAALVCAVSTAVMALFWPATPIIVILVAVWIGGLARPTFFTSINTLGYLDTDDADLSQATAINAVLQNVTMAVGITIGAVLVELSNAWHGGDIAVGDFHFAFLVLGALTVLAILPILPLPPTAGSDVSGHRRGPPVAEE